MASLPALSGSSGKLASILLDLNRLMRTFSSELLKAAEIAQTDKTLPVGVTAALEGMTKPSTSLVSHIAMAQAWLAGEVKEAKDEKKEAKTEEKKEEKLDWSYCDKCQFQTLLIDMKKHNNKAYCLECYEKVNKPKVVPMTAEEIKATFGKPTTADTLPKPKALKRLIQPVPINEAKELPGSEDERKNTLAILNSVMEAKKAIQKFEGCHTTLSFNVTERPIAGLGDMFLRYISNMERCSNEIRQALSEMEIACDQQVLQHCKSETFVSEAQIVSR